MLICKDLGVIQGDLVKTFTFCRNISSLFCEDSRTFGCNEKSVVLISNITYTRLSCNSYSCNFANVDYRHNAETLELLAMFRYECDWKRSCGVLGIHYEGKVTVYFECKRAMESLSTSQTRGLQYATTLHPAEQHSQDATQTISIEPGVTQKAREKERNDDTKSFPVVHVLIAASGGAVIGIAIVVIKYKVGAIRKCLNQGNSTKDSQEACNKSSETSQSRHAYIDLPLGETRRKTPSSVHELNNSNAKAIIHAKGASNRAFEDNENNDIDYHAKYIEFVNEMNEYDYVTETETRRVDKSYVNQPDKDFSKSDVNNDDYDSSEYEMVNMRDSVNGPNYEHLKSMCGNSSYARIQSGRPKAGSGEDYDELGVRHEITESHEDVDNISDENSHVEDFDCEDNQGIIDNEHREWFSNDNASTSSGNETGHTYFILEKEEDA